MYMNSFIILLHRWETEASQIDRVHEMQKWAGLSYASQEHDEYYIPQTPDLDQNEKTKLDIHICCLFKNL